jgi:2-polyprenyl-6-methoxyphenol hydroxylase-like FAD-dependent oxidoreductase
MAGLFSALLLRPLGWTVDVYERFSVELSGRGAGIVTHAELCAALQACGLDPTKDLGVAVSGRKTLDAFGKLIATFACPQVVTSWDRVFRMLRDAFPADRYHLGRELQRIEARADSVSVYFADGSRTEADVLIGADGFRSSVRAHTLPEVQPEYAGYIAWRGLVDEAAFSPETRCELFDVLTFCLPPREQFLGYPVAGPGNDLREGHRRYNFIWYRPATDDQFRDLLTDETGHTHSLSIPPALVRRDIVESLRGAARKLLAPQLQRAIELTPQPFLQPIYDVESPRMAIGRIALVGDAAFVGRPHVAAGVTKAAEDALALATALRHIADVPAALQSFERARIEVDRSIVDRGRELGLYFRPEWLNAEDLGRAARHHTPDSVMAEIAILDFLRTPAHNASPREN